MSVVLNPYLNFPGNAREAMSFYASVFGGKLTLNTFADFGGSGDPEDDAKIMHGQIDAPHGLVLMGADVPASMEGPGPITNGSISLSGDDEAALSGYFTALAADGTVTEPLTRAPWGDSFGMLVDRFGVDWLVNISGSATNADGAQNPGGAEGTELTDSE
ncbi:VOC family protein [Mycetocola zhadangensis]|uniref:VOC family protein n=1 Tax=Mycetocola zhadangensis TaxID=1164595 RepID=UPI003A4DB27A